MQTLQSDGSIDYTLIEKSEDTYMRKPKTPIEDLCNYGCYNAATMQLTLNKIESLSEEDKEKYAVNITRLKESLEADIYATNGAKTFIESNPRLKFYKQIENSPDWESPTYTFTIDGKFQPKNVHCYISSAIEYAFNIVFDDDNLIDLINKKLHLSLEIDKYGLDPLTEWIEKNLDAYPTETYSAYNIYSTDDFLKVYDFLISIQNGTFEAPAEKITTTYHVGDLICYKGFEETVFQIIGFKGNNYVVIELGDRTRTKNEIPFADKDKLQKVLPPIIKHEAMLASSKKTLSGIEYTSEHPYQQKVVDYLEQKRKKQKSLKPPFVYLDYFYSRYTFYYGEGDKKTMEYEIHDNGWQFPRRWQRLEQLCEKYRKVFLGQFIDFKSKRLSREETEKIAGTAAKADIYYNLIKNKEYYTQIYATPLLLVEAKLALKSQLDVPTIQIEKIEDKDFIRKYNSLKKEYPELILLFGDGTWYYAINEDATKVAINTGLQLIHIPKSKRNSNQPSDFVYIAYPQLHDYLPKLVKSGERFAIVDELKGLQGTSENLSGHFKGTSTPTKIIDKGDDFSYFDYPKDVIDKFYTYITLSKLDKAIPVYSNYFFDEDGHLCFPTRRTQDIIDCVDIDRCLKGYEDLKHEWIAKAEDNINGFIWQFFINDTEFSPRGSYNYKILNRDLVELLLGYARKFEETSEIYPDKLGVENLQDYNKTKEILTKRLAELDKQEKKPKQTKKPPTIPTIQPERLLKFDRNRLYMSCVHCVRGYKFYSDAHFLLKLKSDYPKSYEGKNVMPKHFFKKFEEFIINPEKVLFYDEGAYPVADAVIYSTLSKIKYSVPIDIQSLYQYLCDLIDYYEKQTGEEVKDFNRHLVPMFYNGQHAFTMDIVRLKQILSAAKLINADTIKWVDYSYAVVLQNSKSDNGEILLIMPHYRDETPTITDGKCLIDDDWDIWYKPYDLANTRKANILITEAKLCKIKSKK